MVWLKTLRLKSENPRVRQRVVEKLAGSDNSHDTELLVASLNDTNSQVRCAAVRALQKAPEEACIQGLLTALRDESGDVRAAAADILGRRGNSTLTYPLSMMLNDCEPRAREAAAKALQNLSWKPSTSEEQVRFEIALSNTHAAASAGPASSKPQVAETQHDTSFQRRAAADGIKDLNDLRSLKALLQTLADPDPSVRVSAIHALEAEEGEAVTIQLRKLVGDRDSNVRLTAVQVLSRRPQCPPEHFLPLLKDPNFEIRVTAVQFLGKFSHAEIARAVIPLLFDSDNDVRRAAAKSLGEIRCALAVEPLIMTLADEQPEIRNAAEYALGQIDRDWPQSEPARRALAPLETLLDQRASWVRSAMQQVLDKIRAG